MTKTSATISMVNKDVYIIHRLLRRSSMSKKHTRQSVQNHRQAEK